MGGDGVAGAVAKKAAGMGMLGAPLAGMGNTYVPTKRVETAKLLVGPRLAAAVEFPTYAFASERFNAESNVSVALSTNTRPAARFSLGFGHAEAGLFYDPTIYFAPVDDMALPGGFGGGAGGDAPGAGGSGANGTAAYCRRGDTECVKARRRERAGAKNAAGSAGGGLLARALVGLAAGGAALALAALG